MNLFRNNVGTLNEILFEKRNQNYGAYVIRKSYNSTVLKSLLLTASIFIFGFFGLSLLVNTKVELPNITVPNIIPEITTTFDGTKPKIKKPEIQKPTTAASKPIVQAIIGTIIIDSTDKAVNTTLNTNIQSTGTNTLNTTTTIPGTGTSTLTIESTNTLTVSSGATTAPDVLPFMPGLSKFLTDNLVYPYPARENGISGKVWVNFVVDEQGKIIETKIMHSVGFGCDEEALRVIKLMPKWKPGLLQGKPVKVSFNQPITFRTQ